MQEIKELKEYVKYIKDVTKDLDVDFADFIAEDTKLLISSVEFHMDLRDTEWQEKIKKILYRIREISNIIISIYNAEEGTIPSAIVGIIIELSYLHRSVVESECEENISDVFNDYIAEMLSELTQGEVVVQDREHWFTQDDIEKLKQRQKPEEKHEIEKSFKQEIIDKWHSENINPNPNFNLLEENDYDIIKLALETNKIVSASWLQRMFCIGYRKAIGIMDRFEKAEIISPYDVAKKLDTGRIVRITLESIQSR